MVLILGGVACSDDDDTATPQEPAATSAPAATPTAPTDTTTTASTPSTSPRSTDPPALECGAIGGVPAGATGDVAASVDADGDGVPDVLRSYRLDGSWHLSAELSSGGVTEHVVIPGDELGPGVMRAVGGTDLTGGDRRMELLVVQGAGAYTQIVALYQLEGCRLVPILLPHGGEAAFPVGSSVQQRSTLLCGSYEVEPVNWLFEQSATRTADNQWDVHSVGYAMADGSPPRLVQTVTQDDVLPDEAMLNRPSFRCDDLSLDSP
ncbi:MAG: hypothetical protein ACRD0U_06120 [Acidimicrobiales bacterium]